MGQFGLEQVPPIGIGQAAGSGWVERPDYTWRPENGYQTPGAGGSGAGGGGVPVGSIIMFGSSTIPDGWLLCDGSAFDTQAYPDLVAVLPGGYTPNLRDKFVLGAGATAHGTTGGSATATLLPTHLPGHQHVMTHGHTENAHNHYHAHTVANHGHAATANIDAGGQHSHTFRFIAWQASVFATGGAGAWFTDSSASTNPEGLHTHGVSVSVQAGGPGATGYDSTGATATINNYTGSTAADSTLANPFSIVPPYYALTFIIKAK